MKAKDNGNPNVATCGGGIMEHGLQYNPQTGEGDTFFIDPYDPRGLYYALAQPVKLYYDFVLDHDEKWLRIRKTNFERGKMDLGIRTMIQKYHDLAFMPIMAEERKAA